MASPFWIELRFEVSSEHADLLLGELAALTSLGCYENIPLDQNHVVQDKVIIIAYFADEPNISAQDIGEKILDCLNTKCLLASAERIPLANWATEWKKYFKPMQLAPGLIIRPSWEEYTAQSHEKVITLDPGMAFGTGQHDTTRFCAELIGEIKTNCPDLETLLDVGCGSGILCFTAAIFGFQHALGVDIDAASIEACEENRERNPEIKDNVSFQLTDGSLQELENKTFDVIVANIFAETVCELKPILIKHLQPQGHLIISGVIKGADSLIKNNFSEFKLRGEHHSDEWHAYWYESI